MIPVIRKRSYSPSLYPNFFDNDFDSFFGNRKFTPAVNVKEDEKKYEIEMALPGMDKEDIKIELEKDILMISSEHKNEKKENYDSYSRREFGYQTFCRNFTIPENAESEKIAASFKNGILVIEIPKSKEEVKLNRVIKIS
ncbi:MAG: Hsp20/alpha crystallin family protein [Marinilabiliaceae bacterium]|jgi:HSP20 family protein|nr:Hsp20/alpha crystallin family protein [Marinilabiliaceae bacterium]